MVSVTFSFFQSLNVIKYCLFMQCLQMMLSNFNIYEFGRNSNDDNGFTNYQALNMITSVFSVMFNVFNTLFIMFTFQSNFMKRLLVFLVFFLQIVVLVFTNFVLTDMSYHTYMALSISVVYTLILVPSFVFIIDALLNETIDEAKISYAQRNQFKWMFDSLQEGVIVIAEKEITFINDLANKLLSEVSHLKNFLTNTQLDDSKDLTHPLDKQIFYVFENSKDGAMTKGANKKKKWTSSEASKTMSHASSIAKKVQYSLRELSKLPVFELHSKVFTFNSKLSGVYGNDITKMVEETSNLDLIIQNLKCMYGIDSEFVPSFKFFQFKKSIIRSSIGSQEDQVMLCFSDISQKILYDTTKAEGEFLSLINSTISHEMRNPLNSIINQCKIIYAMCQTFRMVLTDNEYTIQLEISSQLEDIYNEIMKSINLMTSSSNLLLLNVEDILGFAQLKAGKFVKNIKRFSIKRAIDEIVAIQQYQAESKNIHISTKFFGFPGKAGIKYASHIQMPVNDMNLVIESDEKRIKQVLINL